MPLNGTAGSPFENVAVTEPTNDPQLSTTWTWIDMGWPTAAVKPDCGLMVCIRRPVGLQALGEIVSGMVWDALKGGAEESFTVIVTLKVPDAVGVPLSMPAELRMRPAGRPEAD